MREAAQALQMYHTASAAHNLHSRHSKGAAHLYRQFLSCAPCKMLYSAFISLSCRSYRRTRTHGVVLCLFFHLGILQHSL
jgi:hypothetical protein